MLEEAELKPLTQEIISSYQKRFYFSAELSLITKNLTENYQYPTIDRTVKPILQLVIPHIKETIGSDSYSTLVHCIIYYTIYYTIYNASYKLIFMNPRKIMIFLKRLFLILIILIMKLDYYLLHSQLVRLKLTIQMIRLFESLTQRSMTI